MMRNVLCARNLQIGFLLPTTHQTILLQASGVSELKTTRSAWSTQGRKSGPRSARKLGLSASCVLIRTSRHRGNLQASKFCETTMCSNTKSTSANSALKASHCFCSNRFFIGMSLFKDTSKKLIRSAGSALIAGFTISINSIFIIGRTTISAMCARNWARDRDR